MKRFLFFLTIIMLVTQFSITAAATTIGFDAVPVSDERLKEYIENSSMEVSFTESRDYSIACFDVSESGLIAIGFDGSPNIVQIYSSDGTFLYRYDFECDGTYGIAFIGDNLAVYYVRGSLIKVFDSDGQVIGVYDVPLVSSNGNKTYDLLTPTTKQINGKIYRLERDIGLFDRFYSKLIETNEDGEDIVLYDVTAAHNFKVVIATIFILAFFIFCIRGVIKQELAKEQKEN